MSRLDAGEVRKRKIPALPEAGFDAVATSIHRGVRPPHSKGHLIDVLARVDDYPNNRIAELTPQGWLKSKNN